MHKSEATVLLFKEKACRYMISNSTTSSSYLSTSGWTDKSSNYTSAKKYMFKNNTETKEIKYFPACQKPQLISALEGRGGACLGLPLVSHISFISLPSTLSNYWNTVVTVLCTADRVLRNVKVYIDGTHKSGND